MARGASPGVEPSMAREATATPGNFLGEALGVVPPIAIAAIARSYVATSPRLGRLAGPGRAYGRWPGLPVAEIRPRPDQRTRPPGEIGGPTYLQK